MRRSASRPSSARILLVDAHPLGLKVRKTVLEESGHHITAVGCPAEALQLFTSGQFDMVVTDLKMPKLNGLELIKALREHDGAARVILISGFSDLLGHDANATGADAVIQKSSNEVTHLLRAVERLMKPLKKPNASQRRNGATPPKQAKG